MRAWKKKVGYREVRKRAGGCNIGECYTLVPASGAPSGVQNALARVFQTQEGFLILVFYELHRYGPASQEIHQPGGCAIPSLDLPTGSVGPEEALRATQGPLIELRGALQRSQQGLWRQA